MERKVAKPLEAIIRTGYASRDTQGYSMRRAA